MLRDDVMEALAEYVGRPNGWDASPEVFTVYVQGRHVTLSPIPIPPDIWSRYEKPSLALEALAEALSGQRGALIVPPGKSGSLHAVALVHEAFWVDVDRSDPQEERRVQAFVDQGRLRDHPMAREIRFAVAVDRDGVTYQARHVRGKVGTEHDMLLPGEPDAQASGIVVEALDRLVEALTGAKPQQRPEPRMVPPADMN
jgi:hypothetical protein